MKKPKFSKAVLRWSHVWTPREDCTPKEIKIINEIFKELDLKFNKKKNAFSIYSLEICHAKLKRLTFLPPLIVKEAFYCSYNDIESLEGGPIEAKSYYCWYNKLKNLKGAPLKCENFDCHKNPLEDFSVLAEPYKDYYAPNLADLIFIDPSLWTLEEYKNHKKNIETSNLYL